MKRTFIAVVALTTLLLASCSKPEGDLKSHYEKMEEIMADGKEEPEKGIEKFIRYFEENGAEMSKLEMEVQLSVMRIEKEGDREERIKKIREEIETVQKNLEGSSTDFFKAVQNDKKAKAKFDDFQKRARDSRKVRLEGVGMF